MASARHIALITPGFPRDEADTSCIPPLQIALRRLRQRRPDIRITVIALHYPDSRRPYRWHGFEVVPMAGANRPLPLRLPALARASGAIRRLHLEDPVRSRSRPVARRHRHGRLVGGPADRGSLHRHGHGPGCPIYESAGSEVLPLDRAQLTAVSERDRRRACRQPSVVQPTGDPVGARSPDRRPAGLGRTPHRSSRGGVADREQGLWLC